MTAPLLELQDVAVTYGNGVRAVDGVSLRLARGETLAVVGESGCGKSSLGKLAMRLVDPGAGRILFDGRDITGLGRAALRPLRRRFQMIFQDPFASLNPRMTVRTTLETQLAAQGIGTRGERAVKVAAAAARVGLDAAALERYPHEFSGGQRQRIGIARALILEPELVVCDEPVSALDVSIRAQILNLLMDLQAERGLAYLFISHDMGVVEHIADRVAVMYLGRLVEEAPAARLFAAPAHPYTRALLAAVPQPDPRRRLAVEELASGDVPSPLAPPPGCHYHPRCRFATALCAASRPALAPAPGGGIVACHHADAIAAIPSHPVAPPVHAG
ncbi:ABC transporter ATP-binding protein [Falsiroseomonas oryzae]|uniref:ABC transporter ATP-binding protein n=1 Tax=Falsiroseomonas oryzae TaxID=2766473 RepID=UPI0022EA6954|nr:oligopeptide/dipeptide ABC transporter ATP-binding protein [Roseomonas sp. MO-31]